MKRKLLAVIFITALMTLSASAFSSEGLVNISKERKMFMHCQGEGSPTVILIAGFPDRGDASWETPLPGKSDLTVFTAVSKFTRVCDYDRPGTIKVVNNKIVESRSDPVQQPINSMDQAKDLHALVNAADIKKPFIIVAHSAGGLAARLYALKYHGDVSGMILVDATNENLYKEWTKKEIEVFKFGTENATKELIPLYKNIEQINFDEAFKELESYKDQKLHIPAIVLTSGIVPDANKYVKDGSWPKFVTQKMANSIVEGVHRSNILVAKSFVPEAKIINVDSGHYIQKEQPNLLIKLVHNMVEKQRKENKSDKQDDKSKIAK